MRKAKMFLNHPGKPTQGKKAIYLLATTFLGVLLSFVVHAIVEIRYLQWLEGHDLPVAFIGGCALPPAFRILLLALGLFGGLALGNYWWRRVYIEKVWQKR